MHLVLLPAIIEILICVCQYAALDEYCIYRFARVTALALPRSKDRDSSCEICHKRETAKTHVCDKFWHDSTATAELNTRAGVFRVTRGAYVYLRIFHSRSHGQSRILFQTHITFYRAIAERWLPARWISRASSYPGRPLECSCMGTKLRSMLAMAPSQVTLPRLNYDSICIKMIP